MNVLIVHNKEINFYPPVKSLVEILLDLEYKVTLITYDRFGYEKEKESNPNFKLIRIEAFRKEGKVQRLTNIYFVRKKIQRCVRELMNSHDILWTTTDNTVSVIGKDLYKYKNHIMQLMELVEDTPIFYYEIAYRLKLNKIITVGLNKYAKNAKCVVVPEVNRAHITKVMWDLDKLPSVLPNKPYNIQLKNPSDDVIEVLDKIRKNGKKIILYQGVFLKERKLEEFAQAVRNLGTEYVFCIMGKDTLERRQLCEKYPDIMYIPFIAPPYHLLVTQLAYIGVLTYFPTADNLPGKLNVVYCAPNKIYEYAYCALPMIGNNIPGLSEPFQKYHIGMCFEEMTADSIADTIRVIEQDYSAMKNNCKAFYDNVDMMEIVKKIVGDTR